MFENWNEKDFANVQQRASSTTVACHAFVVEYLDRQYGPGFSAAHPEVVTPLTGSAATHLAGEMLARAVEFGLRGVRYSAVENSLDLKEAINGVSDELSGLKKELIGQMNDSMTHLEKALENDAVGRSEIAKAIRDGMEVVAEGFDELNDPGGERRRAIRRTWVLVPAHEKFYPGCWVPWSGSTLPTGWKSRQCPANDLIAEGYVSDHFTGPYRLP